MHSNRDCWDNDDRQTMQHNYVQISSHPVPIIRQELHHDYIKHNKFSVMIIRIMLCKRKPHFLVIWYDFFIISQITSKNASSQQNWISQYDCLFVCLCQQTTRADELSVVVNKNLPLSWTSCARWLCNGIFLDSMLSLIDSSAWF